MMPMPYRFLTPGSNFRALYLFMQERLSNQSEKAKLVKSPAWPSVISMPIVPQSPGLLVFAQVTDPVPHNPWLPSRTLCVSAP
jgi:hypothetical protein